MMVEGNASNVILQVLGLFVIGGPIVGIILWKMIGQLFGW